ncbi:MAG: ester cyclase [Anaerolineae bacterium]|nr:ester cyclase [Anaerolineae bacterium]
MNQYVAESDEDLRQHIAVAEAGFPRYELPPDDIIAEGDKVVVRATMRATHLGEFFGVPATGKEVTMPLIIIYRIADGQIVEHWIQMDVFGLMQQLGAIPVPA